MIDRKIPCSLEAALDYENEDVVQRFLTLYDMHYEQAVDVFNETKKWLWLASLPDSPGVAIFKSMFIIDEMWHNFVLFTVDYTRYCYDRFGRYLHHVPKPHREKLEYKERLARDRIAVRDDEMEKLSRKCAFIQNRLGTSTLIKWFVDYGETYNDVFFNHRRVPVSLCYDPPAELRALADHIKSGRLIVAG